ncbi:MAG TPA: class I SAM-dependent methyltransferase [Sneathiellales bacterium]|nr:class I SAM-dependent methyltransferase [Sneathiellales bacterium]
MHKLAPTNSGKKQTMSTKPDIDSETFREFELTGWRKVSAEYQEYYSRVTRQTVEPLLDAVGAGQGMRILDVATGPGYVAAAATTRGAVGVGIDFSEPQIELARQQFAGSEFHVSDAEDLPFPDQDFDGVVINFGVLHFPQPEVAISEAFRVLRKGGRLAFTVWAASEVSKAFDIVERALKTHGNLDLPLPKGPYLYRFSDPEECSRVLLAAGFDNPTSTLVNSVWRFPAPETLFEAVSSAGVRMTSVLNLQTPAALENIRAQMRNDCAKYVSGDMIELPMGAILSTANKT